MKSVFEWTALSAVFFVIGSVDSIVDLLFLSGYGELCVVGLFTVLIVLFGKEFCKGGVK